MSLTDREILQLNELCDALIEGSATDAQRQTLERWVARSDDARKYYVRCMDLSASLGRYASEMQMGPADRGAWAMARPRSKSAIAAWGRFAVAASILVAGGAWAMLREKSAPAAKGPTAEAVGPLEFVARITGAKDVAWKDANEPHATGAFLRRGTRVELEHGFAQVTFDCGAVILLEGPASLEVNSAWVATLREGALTANVPQQAIGFRVANQSADVVDLGTSFSMVANDDGAADVLVLEGEVEATQRGPDSETISLKANESRRFTRAAVTPLEDSEQLFERFHSPIPLDRIDQQYGFVRWSFDDARGRVFPAEATDMTFDGETANLRIQASSPQARAEAHRDGFKNRGIAFDADLVARARVPGLSGSGARTIAFWVRTPESAQLSNAYSMAAWRADSEKLGSRPVHIGWNRNPAEGPLGAVRTDFSGGHAIGATPLRDGRWHHVAVIFLPGDDPDEAVQVKQYVDGRLESNTVTPGERRSVAAKVKADDAADAADWLWLGCRLGANGPRKERFRGDIDELVIANRGLEPNEIVTLMGAAEDAPAGN